MVFGSHKDSVSEGWFSEEWSGGETVASGAGVFRGVTLLAWVGTSLRGIVSECKYDRGGSPSPGALYPEEGGWLDSDGVEELVFPSNGLGICCSV